MTWLLVIVLLVAGNTAAYAEGDSLRVWNKWCQRADTPVLFATANNMIQVCGMGYKASDLTIKSLDNALKIGAPEGKGDTISFMAMPYPKYGKRMRLTITHTKTGKLLKTVSFSAEDAPQPVARLGSIAATEAKRKEILAQTALRVGFAHSLYCYPYRVKEYTFKSRIAGKDIVIPVKGFFISKEVQQILSNAPEGAFLEFVNIKATCPDCADRALPDMKLWMR